MRIIPRIKYRVVENDAGEFFVQISNFGWWWETRGGVFFTRQEAVDLVHTFQRQGELEERRARRRVVARW